MTSRHCCCLSHDAAARGLPCHRPGHDRWLLLLTCGLGRACPPAPACHAPCPHIPGPHLNHPGCTCQAVHRSDSSSHLSAATRRARCACILACACRHTPSHCAVAPCRCSACRHGVAPQQRAHAPVALLPAWPRAAAAAPCGAAPSPPWPCAGCSSTAVKGAATGPTNIIRLVDTLARQKRLAKLNCEGRDSFHSRCRVAGWLLYTLQHYTLQHTSTAGVRAH